MIHETPSRVGGSNPIPNPDPDPDPNPNYPNHNHNHIHNPNPNPDPGVVGGPLLGVFLIGVASKGACSASASIGAFTGTLANIICVASRFTCDHATGRGCNFLSRLNFMW